MCPEVEPGSRRVPPDAGCVSGPTLGRRRCNPSLPNASAVVRATKHHVDALIRAVVARLVGHPARDDRSAVRGGRAVVRHAAPTPRSRARRGCRPMWSTRVLAPAGAAAPWELRRPARSGRTSGHSTLRTRLRGRRPALRSSPYGGPQTNEWAKTAGASAHVRASRERGLE